MGEMIEMVVAQCYTCRMGTKGFVSHDRRQETIDAKVRWFCSLSVADRMEILCEVTDLALSANPDLPRRKDAQSPARSIQVISAP